MVSWYVYTAAMSDFKNISSSRREVVFVIIFYGFQFLEIWLPLVIFGSFCLLIVHFIDWFYGILFEFYRVKNQLSMEWYFSKRFLSILIGKKWVPKKKHVNKYNIHIVFFFPVSLSLSLSLSFSFHFFAYIFTAYNFIANQYFSECFLNI